jgi:hypothetical protein
MGGKTLPLARKNIMATTWYQPTQDASKILPCNFL